LIAFTDDDTIPAEDWLAQGERAMRDMPQAVALHGAVEVPIGPTPTDHERNTSRLQDAGFVTANCFVRRHVLQQIGGFDERFTRAWREDSDLFFALLGRGPVLSAAGPVVVHPVREVPWGFSVRSHSNLQFDALLYKKNRLLYRRYVQAAPPWSYYIAVLGALLAALSAAIGAGASAWAGLVLWAVPNAALLRRRLRGTSHRLRDLAEVTLTTPAIPFVAVAWRLSGAIRWRVLFL
jgi:hypothetical protein